MTSNEELIATGGDTAIRPQDDLFRSVNGHWLASFEIPADRARFGEFHRLAEEAEHQVRALIEDAAANPAGGPNPTETAKIAALYTAFMDTDAVEAAGAAPLRPELDAVASTESHADLARILGELQRAGIGGAIEFYVDNDSEDPEVYTLYAVQSGLGLPDESYYTDDANAQIRAAYPGHVARQLTLATGADDATAAEQAQRILDLETTLAHGHWDRVKDRDAVATNNPVTRGELEDLLPGFEFAEWVNGLGLQDSMLNRVIVREPSYLEAFAVAWQTIDLDDWKLWLTWRVIRSRAPFLTAAIVEENFDFYGRTLTGTPQLRDRWKRGVAFVEGAIGDAVARLYVDRHFPPDHKAKMDALVAQLIEAYRQSITSLEWMTPTTRERALEKLSKFTPKIGYPVKWKDYSDLVLEGDLVAMAKAAAEHETVRELGKLGGPVDRDEWFMTPQTVNAYYNPGMNEIVFPAAILQPPFFSPDASDAANFGGIGAVIGHEIGHGFDDQGSQFDGDGRLQNWWTEQDRAEFEARTSALVAQYDQYTPAQLSGETVHVNGELTLGENIGDLGGLGIAIKAYRLAVAEQGVDDDQERAGLRELLQAWGLIWRTKGRNEEVRRLLTIDPHSPEEFRCNGVVRNLDVFAEVFDTKPGDALWLDPAERVSIW